MICYKRFLGGKRGPMTEDKKTEDKNLTINDIADALGVSKTTVSRAISGKGRIGEETRARVLQYIEAHNYRPNVIAKGWRSPGPIISGWSFREIIILWNFPFFRTVCSASAKLHRLWIMTCWYLSLRRRIFPDYRGSLSIIRWTVLF